MQNKNVYPKKHASLSVRARNVALAAAVAVGGGSAHQGLSARTQTAQAVAAGGEVPSNPNGNKVTIPVSSAETAQSTIEIPAVAKKYMADNAVWMSNLDRCSGMLIRSPYGVPVGVVTAAHCGFLVTSQNNYPTSQRLGPTNNQYVVMQQVPIASLDVDSATETGFEIVDQANKFMVPDADDLTTDVVFGAFPGSTTKLTQELYDASKLSQAEINSLKPGSTMYMAGYPVYQPDQDQTNAGFQRQEFGLEILGQDDITSTTGQQLHVLWAALPVQSDGTECSFGASGSEGFVIIDGKPRAVGVLSVFNDFTDNIVPDAGYPTQHPEYYTEKFGIDINTGYSAVCGFSWSEPTVANGGVTVSIVASSLKGGG